MLFRHNTGGVRWMIVFLGNPGTKYERTRHNAGWIVGDVVAGRCGVKIQRLKNRALTAQCTLGGQETLLVKPQTFMNSSGEAVRLLADFYKIPPERILVVSDEIALPPGRMRLRSGGSAGGHNGLKSIISCLGTDKFPRLRMGVGSPTHPDYEMIDWVLGNFNAEDEKIICDTAERAADAIECFLSQGIDRAMSLYNTK